MLEGRAYVKSQIGQLEAALDDGNRMLTVDKTNPMVQSISDATNYEGLYMLRIIIGAQEETEVGHEMLCTRAQAMSRYASEIQGISVPYQADSRLSLRHAKSLSKRFQKANL